MGYYTRYKIDAVEIPTQCDSDNGDAFVVALCCADLLDMKPATVAQFNNWDSLTWYDHEQHVAKAMRKSGATSVTLSGEGEEVGDKWEKRFSVEDDGEVWCREYRYELRRPESPTKEGRVKL